MVLLRYNQIQLCGGSVLDPWHLLTAAHCVDGLGVDSQGFVSGYLLDVIVGKHETDTSQDYRPEQRADVAKVYVHRSFAGSPYYFNDIALMRLETPLTFNSRVAPVCLPTVTSRLPSRCIAAGWGTTVFGLHLPPPVLHDVTMQAYNYTECERTFSTVFRLATGMNINPYLFPGVMCAANFTTGGLDTCQGDSGGPLFCLEGTGTPDRHYTQFGIVSSGYGCGDPGSPGFYTYTPHYVDWVENVAKPNLDYAVKIATNPCLRTNCLDVIQTLMAALQKPALCRLIEAAINCMISMDYTGICTRESTYEITIAHLTYEAANGRLNNTFLLNATIECRATSVNPNFDVCTDKEIQLEIAKNYCNLSDTTRIVDLCLRVFPAVGQCTNDVLTTSSLGNCAVEEVTSTLTAASPLMQHKDSLCSPYCPSFDPHGCLYLLRDSYFMGVLGVRQTCSVYHEAVRCVSAKQELAGNPCEDNRVRLTIAQYLRASSSSFFTYCDSQAPQTGSGLAICENSDLHSIVARRVCLYRSCSDIPAFSSCLELQVRYLTTFCPLETLRERLSATYNCDQSNGTVVPSQPCSGQSVADAVSRLATDYCDLIANKLSLTWNENNSCSEVSDLLRCVTRVANYVGYTCTEQNIVTLTSIMTHFPVASFLEKLKICAVLPSMATERVSGEMCEDEELVRLMARYSCSNYFETVMSSNKTFCQNLNMTKDCIRTGFSFYGQRCEDVHRTVYNMHTPLIYYMNSYDRCPFWNATQPLQIRLVGGASANEGRIELFYNGQWGTVCDDFFDTSDAIVACRMLGYTSGTPTYEGSAYYGQGTGPILLDDLYCTGSEQSLFECRHNGIGNHNCGHFEDVGVSCPGPLTTTPAPPNEGEPLVSRELICRFFPIWSSSLAPCHVSFQRLTTDTQCSGLEETVSCVQTELMKTDTFCERQSVYGRILSLLDDSQRDICAEVRIDMPPLCRDGAILPFVATGCGEGHLGCERLWDLVMCVHTTLDPQWEQCSSFEIENALRRNSDKLSSICQDYDVRKLEDGRVMTYVQGDWLSPCADDWGQAEASVVCRQLGFTHGKPSFVPQQAGAPSLNVTCAGKENSLDECALENGFACSSSHTAAVVCYNSSYTFKLTNGHYGNVTLTRDEGQGPVCLPEVTNYNAHVLCLEAGFYGGSPLPTPQSSSSPGPVWLLDMACRVETTDVNACLRPPYWRREMEVTNGTACQLASVFCYTSPARFHTGFFNSTGVLLMYQDGGPTHLDSLLPVCRNNFTGTSAAIFCREAGFPQGGVSVPYLPFTVPFYYNYVVVECTGDETRIEDCPLTHVEWRRCTAPAYVRCNTTQDDGTVPELSVKLASDNSQVLVYADGQWGTVCADHWTDTEAEVVCRQLGYLYGYAHRTSLVQVYPHVLHEMWCDVNSTSLLNCSFQNVRSDACMDVLPAAIICTNFSRPVYTLQGGSQSHYGRLYTTYDGVSAPVRTSSYSSSLLFQILCDSLGFYDGELYRGPLQNVDSELAWLVEFYGYSDECYYSTTSLGSDVCRLASNLTLVNCSDDDDYRCLYDQPIDVYCYPSKIRLHTGFSNTTGVVQKYIPEWRSWFEMCRENITQSTADVICRDVMASPTAAAVIFQSPSNFFPAHSMNPYPVTVTCRSDDVTAADCITVDHYGSCSTSGSATVACYDGPRADGNITGWSVADDGRLLVQRYGTWGTLSGYYFDSTAANVVCRHMGYSGGTALPQYPQDGRRPLWVQQMSCWYPSYPLSSCSIYLITDSSGWSGYWDARVSCYGNLNVTSSPSYPWTSDPFPYSPTTTTVPDLPPGPGGNTCGEVKHLPNARIVGGMEAERGQFPWMVMLLHDGDFACAGSIIDPLHVVTATHCVEAFSADSQGFVFPYGRLEIIAGKHFYPLYPASVAEQRVTVSRGLTLGSHNSYVDDIAVLLLEHPLHFNSRVAAICLPERFQPLPSICMTAGWGNTAYSFFGGLSPNALLHVTMNAFNYERCLEVFASGNDIYSDTLRNKMTPGFMCAANITAGGVGSCNGDSGGPLFCLNPAGTAFQMFGVTSWGFQCNVAPDKPSVYAFVPYYRHMLDEAVHMLGSNALENNTCFTPHHPHFTAAYECVTMMWSVPGLDWNQTCRLFEEVLSCVSLVDNGICTSDVIAQEVGQYVIGRLVTSNSSSAANLTAAELNATFSQCLDDIVDICEDEELVTHIAASRLCYTPGQFQGQNSTYDTCMEVVPNLSDCVWNVLNTTLRRPCERNQLTSALVSQANGLPQLLGMTSLDFQQCADFCSGFKPVIQDADLCLGILGVAHSAGHTNETLCMYYYEALSCISYKLELRNQKCSDQQIVNTLQGYMQKIVPVYLPDVTTCLESYPGSSQVTAACENPALLASISDICGRYQVINQSISYPVTDCTQAEQRVICAISVLESSEVYCPSDVVMATLAERVFGPSISAACLPPELEPDVIPPGLNCSGEDADAVISSQGRQQCSFLLNRLLYLSDETQRCDLTADLLKCLSQATRYVGYDCSEADILRQNTSLITSSSLDLACGGTVEADTALGAVAQNVCMNHDLVQLAMDRLCAAVVDAALKSESHSCRNFLVAAECVRTSMYLNTGVECSNLTNIMYQLLTPTVYYVANLTTCGAQSPVLSASDIRLVGGSGPWEGRVEVYIDGEWGTVCDDNFGIAEAMVVCRMLGYSDENPIVRDMAYFGQGSGRILLDGMQCTGYESHILSCSHNGVGVHDCSHSEDVGVVCPSLSNVLPSSGSSHVDRCRYFSIWDDAFSTCHPGFAALETDSSCRYMASAVECAQASLIAQDWYCGKDGVFDRLLESLVDGPRQRQCEALGSSYNSYCYDQAIIAVAVEMCRPKKSCRSCCSLASQLAECVMTTMRNHNPVEQDCNLSILTQGIQALNWTSDWICRDKNVALDEAGRVFVAVSDQFWEPMCGDLWTDTEANVLCRETGFAHGVASHRSMDMSAVSAFGGNYTLGRWISYAICLGAERTLGECWMSYDRSCDYFHAAVQCYDHDYNFSLVPATPGATYGAIRFSGDDGTGDVCVTSEFGDREAHVLCRATGHVWGVARPQGATVPSQGPVWRVNMTCSVRYPWEPDVSACLQPPYWQFHNGSDGSCTVPQVTCHDSKGRLLGETSENLGVVMVYHMIPREFDVRHSPVCVDGFGDQEAGVLCREIGFRLGGQALNFNPFFPMFVGYSVACDGNEASLEECRVSDDMIPCGGELAPAVVNCTRETAAMEEPDETVKLNSADQREVLVYDYGQWGTICADHWTDSEATVVCRQLFNTSGLAASVIVERTYPHLLHQVTCNETEHSELSQCSFRRLNTSECQNTAAAGVLCINPMMAFTLRGGQSPNYGLVYVTNSTAGSVPGLLNASLSDEVYDVLCRSLGYTGGQEYRGAVSLPEDAANPVPLWQAEFNSPYCFNNLTASADLCRSSAWEQTECTRDSGNSSHMACLEGVARAFCYTSRVRLHMGFHNTTGIVKFLQDGVWWEICPDNFTQSAADVICRDVMASHTASALILEPSDVYFRQYYSGPPQEKRIISNCSDKDVTAADCISVDVDSHCDSSASGTAALVCYDGVRPNGNITGWRLAEDGRLLVERYGTWGTVCGMYASYADSQKVCRYFGYDSGWFINYKTRSESLPLWVSLFSCENGTRLEECAFVPTMETLLLPYPCYYYDYAVECYMFITSTTTATPTPWWWAFNETTPVASTTTTTRTPTTPSWGMFNTTTTTGTTTTPWWWIFNGTATTTTPRTTTTTSSWWTSAWRIFNTTTSASSIRP